MELMTLIWIVVVVLAVIHGLARASQPRNTPAARVPPPALSPTNKGDDEPEHYSAIEWMARTEHGMTNAPKNVQTWAIYDDN